MQSIHKTLHAINCGVIAFWLLLASHAPAFSQVASAASRPLLVGVMAHPPLAMKAPENRWEGFGIEIWQAVAEKLGVSFGFEEYSSLESLLQALERNEIDVIPALAVQERYELTMDFSQSYLESGRSIAVPAEARGYRWMKIIESVFSLSILKAIGLLFLISLIFAIIVWSFERRHNSQMFGGRFPKGIGDGIWWAIVTMTTVGYGDKAPKTAGGRIFAIVWMSFSIVFFASLTANITSQLTISGLKGKVQDFNDLFEVRVGCLSGSGNCSFLTRNGIAVIPFESTMDGLSALDGNRIDAFVDDENILHWLLKKKFPGRLRVVGGTFDEYFVSIALPIGSPLRKPINQALLTLMETEKWDEILNRHIR